MIDIDIHGIVAAERLGVDEVLDGPDGVIEKVFSAGRIACKPSHTVINGNNIGIKTGDQVVKRGKGGDAAAGRHINVHPEGGHRPAGMRFGIGVNRHMAGIQVRRDAGLGKFQDPAVVGRINLCLKKRPVGDQDAD